MSDILQKLKHDPNFTTQQARERLTQIINNLLKEQKESDALFVDGMEGHAYIGEKLRQYAPLIQITNPKT